MTYLVENETVCAASFDFILRLNTILAHGNPEKKAYFTEKEVPNLI
jgi:hypothetical protein